MTIEVEIRSFISKEKFEELIEFFKKEGNLIEIETDETEYYADQGGVRLWKNNDYAKIILKSGNIHDDCREEYEIKFDKINFNHLQKMFEKLNIPKQIKWFRKKYTFEWQNITIQVGHSLGYGYILELEKLCKEEEKEKTLNLLKEKILNLNIEITPKEIFEEKYNYYKNNWKELTKNGF
ncbi:hypothetical protein HOK68_04960 [Candidatus Woesearchaeota archaeon]|jgi:adenylate cyclase class IV|nr:hypothetical protein [Candidatus Woesearchaeota archaeon]MBT4387334.1 hypothetical protein [Candidatus Woesearchaeota archaeon]MBT4595473.1 hypothetical protein [Candidatus Woesearchaeota archaeon]MBT5740836.1 hypothetical protein [Candidatus Woesearchaeota archaeon]MBT6506098.1 hypothetical protein [Candidatus Woesearchaeota archaeon]